MKYKRPSKGKVIIKNIAIGYQGAQKVKNIVKNPFSEIINALVDKAANMDTSRKPFGMQKNRIQMPDPETGKWAVKDTQTDELIRIRSKPGQPYKGIKKVYPFLSNTRSRQCWGLTKKGRRCQNMTNHPSGRCYLHRGRISKRRRRSKQNFHKRY